MDQRFFFHLFNILPSQFLTGISCTFLGSLANCKNLCLTFFHVWTTRLQGILTSLAQWPILATLNWRHSLNSLFPLFLSHDDIGTSSQWVVGVFLEALSTLRMTALWNRSDLHNYVTVSQTHNISPTQLPLSRIPKAAMATPTPPGMRVTWWGSSQERRQQSQSVANVIKHGHVNTLLEFLPGPWKVLIQVQSPEA